MDKFKRIFLLVAIFISCATSARILGVFPAPSISHQVVFRPLMLELVKRGHEVTVITPDPMFPKGEAPKNFTEIDVHDVSYDAIKSFYELSKGTKEDMTSLIKFGNQIIREAVDKQWQVKEVQDIIKGHGKYDLLMLEANIRCTLAFSTVYKVPVIQVSSFGAFFNNYETMGAPTHPFLYPIVSSQKIYNLTMWEKLKELHNVYSLDNMISINDIEDYEMVKNHFGHDVPSINELQNNVDMMFLNVNPIWEGNRPVPPSVIHMGGLPDKPEKDLPKDLQNYLDLAKIGVIYVSFGTNVKPSVLPPEKIQAMINVLSKLPYNVIWKWDKDELPGKSDNIKLSKWLPQSDLLRHPKIKLFVTQGGLQSTDEAIKAGVPLVGIPMLGDQWYNVEKYVYHKIGVGLELTALDEESFSKAVKTVLKDDSYCKNMVRLRTLMQDQPMKPLERAVWWTEHVLRHGGAAHLRSPAANISWAQFLELELVAVVFSSLLAAILILVGIVYSIFKFVCKNDNSRVKVKTK